MGEPRLIGILARRELNVGVLVLAAAGVVAAIIAGHAAPSLLGGLPLLADAALRRFDLSILAGATLFAILRIAQRVDADHASGWLHAFIAAGAKRAHYAAGIILATCASAALLFAPAALSFAATVRFAHGSAELVRLLPTTLALGLLALVHWSVWGMLFALLTRRLLPTLFLAGGTILAPYTLMLLQLRDSGAVDEWLFRLTLLLPPLTWGGSLLAMTMQLGGVSALGVIVLLAAPARAGRTS